MNFRDLLTFEQTLNNLIRDYKKNSTNNGDMYQNISPYLNIMNINFQNISSKQSALIPIHHVEQWLELVKFDYKMNKYSMNELVKINSRLEKMAFHKLMETICQKYLNVEEWIEIFQKNIDKNKYDDDDIDDVMEQFKSIKKIGSQLVKNLYYIDNSFEPKGRTIIGHLMWLMCETPMYSGTTIRTDAEEFLDIFMEAQYDISLNKTIIDGEECQILTPNDEFNEMPDEYKMFLVTYCKKPYIRKLVSALANN